ncbi:hypothetical protein [Desulfotomaculum sp. 1211_IL3151]|uniref:hypothetical protein n=1 Tax=Desulfotomaculum sp. 1211_IL3151 TaxID=3084055 RepID=UPI002FD8BB0F
MLLNRDAIFNLLRANGQNPRYVEGSTTLIETNSAGIFYILEYNGKGRVGWGISDKIVNDLKPYSKSSILFINVPAGEMFIILDPKGNPFASLSEQKGIYKIDRHNVDQYAISYENLDDYISSL